jgi:branched-chain amino acid transport system substrate-binding protein
MKNFSFVLFSLFALTSYAEEYRIGAILPLSGDFANAGEACRNGMLMAKDSLPPEVRTRVSLLFEDYGFLPQKAVSAWQKLRNIDHANVGLTWDSGASVAINPSLTKAGIPLIALSVKPEISRQNENAVNFWLAPAIYGGTALEEAVSRGYKRIARLAAAHEGILEVTRQFDRKAKGRLEVVLSEELSQDTRDFRTLAARIKALPDIDAIALFLVGGQNGLAARQMREMGLHQPLFGLEFFEDVNEVKSSEGALIGQWYVQAGDASNKWLDEYRKRFPDASTFTAGHCHDAVMLVAEAVKRNAPLGTLLRNIKDFSGALGTYSALGEGFFDLPAAVREVRKDGFVTLH